MKEYLKNDRNFFFVSVENEDDKGEVIVRIIMCVCEQLPKLESGR